MFNLETERIIEEIKKHKAKRVMLQLPDGLKPQAKEIQDAIQKETDAEVLIWAGSCFGSCDMPVGIDSFNIDLLFHFGHTQWKFN